MRESWQVCDFQPNRVHISTDGELFLGMSVFYFQYKLYRHVQSQWVWFFSYFGLKMGIDFNLLI